MQDFHGATALDELDAKIIHALQIWPRVPWSTVGSLLNVDPITVARRWSAMSSSGSVWVTAYGMAPGPGAIVTALVEIRVIPRKVDAVVNAIIDLDQVATLRYTLGDWNLSIDWRGTSLRELEAFVRKSLSSLRGVKSIRTFLVTGIPVEGSMWRLNALSRDQTHVLTSTRDREWLDVPAMNGQHPIDDDILRFLQSDGRMSLTTIATETGVSVSTVKRHLGHMMTSRHLVLRTEVTRQISGWPITIKLFADVDSALVADAVQRLSKLSEVRSCLVLVGKYNIMVNAWLRSVNDIALFEARVRQHVPELVIAEREVISSFGKLMRVRIDENGHRLMPPKK